MTDWSQLPIQPAPLNRIVFPCHDLNPNHAHGIDGTELSSGPVHLETLIDGSLYCHDGRHRTLRAQQRGGTTIPARIHP